MGFTGREAELEMTEGEESFGMFKVGVILPAA